jgi:hypothetical protein
MRKNQTTGFTVALAILALAEVAAVPAAADEAARSAEESAIVQVISDAYVDGIHNYRDPAAVRKGFHPDFVMLVLKDGKLEGVPLETWIGRIEDGKKKDAESGKTLVAPGGPRSTEAKFPRVSVSGDAAVAEVEIWRGGKQIFTDFLSLYRFPDGWKIVGKIFYRHP